MAETNDNEPIVKGDDHTIIVEVPAQLGCYRLVNMLGRGGMGEVWLAFDEKLERDVALKLMRKELLANEEAVKRFYREARAVARLNHSNIVQIYTFGEEKKLIYFVMEMVHGETVSQRLKRAGPMPLDEAVPLLLQTIEGLSYANARGIIHRDIKPSNIMVATDFRAKITDFGLAKMVEHDSSMTAAGSTMGSPNYMSPEQARGQEADNRSDIYALGITMFQMLTGKLPFTAATPVSVLLQQIQVPLPEPDELKAMQDGKVLAVIKKMTEKDPDNRYQTYGGLAAAVTALAPGVRVSSAHTPTTTVTPPEEIPGAVPQSPTQFSRAQTEVDSEAVHRPEVQSPAPVPPPRQERKLSPWAIIVPAVALVVVVGGFIGFNMIRSAAIREKTRLAKEDARAHGRAAIEAYRVDQAASVAAATGSPTQRTGSPQPTAAATQVASVAQPTAIVTQPTAAAMVPTATSAVRVAASQPTGVPSGAAPGVPAISPPNAVAIGTYLPPTPAPTPPPAQAQSVRVGKGMQPGSSVPMTDESGQVLANLPIGAVAELLDSRRIGNEAFYRVRYNDRIGFVKFDNAEMVLTGNVNAPTPSPTPAGLGKTLVLGAADGSQKNVTVYTDETQKRTMQELPAGTPVTLVEEIPNSGFIVLLPSGKKGFVVKGLAQPK